MLPKEGSWTHFNLGMWRLPHTHKQLLEARKISNNPTQFWPYLPRARTRFHRQKLSPTRPPYSPFQMPVRSSGCYLCFWPTDYKSEGPTTPSPGLINLLEWLIELGKTHLLTRLSIYYKRILQNTTRWKWGKFPPKGTSVFLERRAWHGGIQKPSASPVWKLSKKGQKAVLWVFEGSFITVVIN